MTENSKTLLDIYHQDQVEFDVENSGAKEKRTVIWANAEELIESVIEKRKLEGFYLIKIMADGGQGFFKVSMTILPANDDPAYDSNLADHIPGKRSRYAEGGMVGKRANWTSVKKLIMLAIVPKIKETYENLKVLFDLTQLNNVPFKFVAYFKLLLIVNGQQTATSTYPCPYCFVTLDELRYRDLEERNVMPSADILKTYGHLKDDHSRFCADGKNKKLARYSNSTVNPPLFREKDDFTMLEKCPPPELHLLQGFVNHLFWSGLVPILGKERALLWPKKLNIIHKGYHGEVFEGNACRILLKEAERLNDTEICQECGYFRIFPFIAAFKIMDQLVENCFRVERRPCNVEKLVGDFHKVVESTGVTITLKLHVILTHLKGSLEFLNANTGLGLWSEQAGESVHHEFLKYWDRYKINAIDAPSYGEKLRRAVAEFSSLHI
ncbi:unnamed protein product [Psylliodes chrysocephalus]|uniref:Uncharacterized protein n=1 Tax=Psylliodes chrysocephalus TaxID=3402493 RepID=A0A9P0CZT0_9CUCU|nr:unnamed protein product [Psylliodes chrysocephala]